ncbi:HD-GYP domain-containing protein [Limisalsivibrio acetivorans]|uniref:HD-GYP domain-containing protein n=1 Tax=Limisalsivibrio acetivorans TaxID=1304888 RepID=UPI0003B4D898|nr:HD-GYP domain-containing protein [Limisalsivibrio acetivorans]
MKTEEKIHINELKPGMTVTKTDKQGLYFPFFDKEITDQRPINVLKNSGVSYVYILNEAEHDTEEETAEILGETYSQLLGKPVDKSDFIFTDAPGLSDIMEAKEVFGRAKESARKLLNTLRMGGKLDVAGARTLTREMVSYCSEKPKVFSTMTQLRVQDDYTFSHSLNVCIISIALGKRLGKGGKDLEKIGLAGLLQNIGMMKIPEAIVNKPDKLTDEEYTTIKKHVEIGAKMLQDAGFDKDIVTAVLHHHEKSDGSGYPYGLTERDISPIAKLTSIADVYDAVTSKKSYSEGKTPSEALKMIFSWSGRHFNETLVKFFINTVGIYPAGTVVLLDSQETGVVLEQGKGDLTKPKILIVKDTAGTIAHNPVVFDLGRMNIKTGKPLKKIISSINPKDAGISPEEVISSFTERYRKSMG